MKSLLQPLSPDDSVSVRARGARSPSSERTSGLVIGRSVTPVRHLPKFAVATSQRTVLPGLRTLGTGSG